MRCPPRGGAPAGTWCHGRGVRAGGARPVSAHSRCVCAPCATRGGELANNNSVCFVAISVDILIMLIGKRNLTREGKGQKANKINAAIVRSLGNSDGSVILFPFQFGFIS